MNFTFKRYLYLLLIIDIILNLVLILMLIFCFKISFISIFLVVVILFIWNKKIIKQMYNVKKFIQENTIERIQKLERDLSYNYLIYDDWYLTDEYMFSVRILKEINYKDIIVVEDGIALVNGGKTLGNKQTIYLKNGEKYKLKSRFASADSILFTEIIKQKNTSTYFGLVEDYLKIKKDNHF